MEVNTSLLSDSYSSVDTSSCKRQDAHDFHFNSNGTHLGLTISIFIMFPVIGVVSWVCAICRFLSYRMAMMNMYAVSHSTANLHREPVDKSICLAIFSPLALVVYRFIQLGSKTIVHLVEATFLAPLCVAIMYALHLAHAYVPFHWPKMIQFNISNKSTISVALIDFI